MGTTMIDAWGTPHKVTDWGNLNVYGERQTGPSLARGPPSSTRLLQLVQNTAAACLVSQHFSENIFPQSAWKFISLKFWTFVGEIYSFKEIQNAKFGSLNK